METLGQYDLGELSLFGGDTLLLELGSPLEPDSPVGFDNVKDGIGHLELPGTGLFTKPGPKTNSLAELPASDKEDNSWLDATWLDTRLDLFGLVNDELDVSATSDNVPTSAPPLAANDESMVSLSAEDLFNNMSVELQPLSTEALESDKSGHLLSEVLNRLSDYVGDVVDNQVCEMDLEEVAFSPVSVDDIESLLSGPASPTTNSISAVESIMSSRSESPTCSMQYKIVDELSDSDSDFEPKKSGSRKRCKPYSRTKLPVDKKERKKGQNRTAALKYRQKKKNQTCVLDDDCAALETKNKDLKDKVESMTREIQYLKDLMADVLKAKGVKC